MLHEMCKDYGLSPADQLFGDKITHSSKFKINAAIFYIARQEQDKDLQEEQNKADRKAMIAKWRQSS